jgi:hypothetical protein
MTKKRKAEDFCQTLVDEYQPLSFTKICFSYSNNKRIKIKISPLSLPLNNVGAVNYKLVLFLF